MTVWKVIENEECYAVALHNYTPSGLSLAPHLPLEVGELVQVLRETRHWYWGRSLRRDGTGAFPKSYVVIRECHVDKCGDTVLASAGGSGVVHDIAVTLREWQHMWKKLYITNDKDFKFMEVSMRALLQLRAQAASGALPQDQLRKVARTALFTIDRGNRTLQMELAVRSPSGQLVDPLKISTYKLNTLHEEADERIKKNMETTPVCAVATPSSVRSYTVCVRVHNFVCRMPDAAELLLALYDHQHNKLTEHLLLRWPPHHLAPVQVFFTDLGIDIKKEKLFLVCHVVRIGAMDAQNIDHRRSSMSAASAAGRGAGSVRRPFGVACADVTRHLSAENTDKHIQVPFYPCEKEKMDALLKQVISNQRELKDAKHSQGLWVTLQMVEGDLKQIREENPHLVVGNTAIARKMGFPEVILPGDARNDLYVTLAHGAFSRGGGKSTERNIELTARLVDSQGKTLENVVSTGASLNGNVLTNEYTSVVYYHDDKPRWQETFKVCLNIEEFKEAHLVFLVRHRSSNEAKDRAEKHFALAYLKLMKKEGITIADRMHDLCVYKIDWRRTVTDRPEEEVCGQCVALPARRDLLPAQAERGLTRGALALLPRDALSIATRLCSTKLTQREEILGVLKWSAQHSEGTLRAALRRLLHVPSEEVVKFLQDILDALFSILTQLHDTEEGKEQHEFTDSSYAVLVLDCLLHVISLVGDHKYQHFQSVLHVYIDQSFCDALAYEKLIAVMVWVLTTADGGETKRLLQCMKCLECLVKIVARSRQLRASLGDHAASTDFKYQFESLLEALVWLMRCEERALTCQGCALKYLPHAIPHALRVYPHVELSKFVVRALSALSLCRLSKQRMLCVVEVVRGPLTAHQPARALLLPHVADTLRNMLRDKIEWDREAALKSRSVGKAARLLGEDKARIHDHNNHQQIVELCIETLGEVVTLLARDDVGPVEADRAELAKRLLPTVLRTAASMLRTRPLGEGFTDDRMLRRIISILLDMVRQMSLPQYLGVVRALEAERGAAGSLVADAVRLQLELLQRPVFDKHWADMLHLQHFVMLHTQTLISNTLRARVQSRSEPALGGPVRAWFSAASALATAPALQLDALPAALRQRVSALYGDMRQTAAALISDMWFSLGDHKRAFIPSLVGPILEASFVRDDDVRNTTIPLFFDMMQTEFNAEGGGDMKELESELIDRIDLLAELGCGDARWRATFVSVSAALAQHAPEGLRQQAFALVAAAARQLDTLLQYREASQRSATPHRMHLTTRVLDFYSQIERPHMYIRYVHKLANMHIEAGQLAEAGLSLQLHAKLLSWSPDALPARLALPAAHRAQHDTQRDLKNALYLEIASLLERGQQGPLAVEAVQELVRVYEAEGLEYGALAELHARLAALYTAMQRSLCPQPGYYRVIYHGTGFPDHLRVPQGYVYRGQQFEQLHSFRERLLDEWPDAQVLARLDPPGDDITQSDGQYLQINPVTPITSDKLKRLSGRPVAEQILEYYKYNNVDKFVFNRPVDVPESDEEGALKNEFATRWLQRTELEIGDTLPGILRWFPVVSARTYMVSPIQAAVESLQAAGRLLRAQVLATKRGDQPVHQLTMRLKGVLDAEVQGGVENYERAFLTPRYEAAHPDHAELIAQLKDLIAEQIPLLKFGLSVHGARSAAGDPLHAHLEARFRDLQHHVHQRYGRKTGDFEPETPEVQLRMPRDSLSYVETSSAGNRMSDVSTGNESVPKSKFLSFSPSAINPFPWTNNSTVQKFGTLNSPKRRDKRRAGRKSEIGTPSSGSQWYTSHSTPNGAATAANNSVNAASGNRAGSNASVHEHGELRELTQELVPERPPRTEADRERRWSQRTSLLTAASHSNRDSIGTTDSNQDEEEPPPLPQKSRAAADDADNNNDAPPLHRYNYDTVSALSARGSFLYNSMSARRTTPAPPAPPAPPPKKKNANREL